MKTAKNKFILSLAITAIVIFLIGVLFHSGMNKGSLPIPTKDQEATYSWRAGNLRVKGQIIPNNCALTTKECKCSLSAENEECVFNFTFEGLNYDANIKATALNTPAFTYEISKGCRSDNSKNISDCTITFKWDNTKPVTEQTQILLDDGVHGKQSLIALQLQAK